LNIGISVRPGLYARAVAGMRDGDVAAAWSGVESTSAESTRRKVGVTSSLRRQTRRAGTKTPPGTRGRAVGERAGGVAERAGARARRAEVALQAEPAELQGRRVVASHRIVLSG
jgi:hypothetical protein